MCDLDKLYGAYCPRGFYQGRITVSDAISYNSWQIENRFEYRLTTLRNPGEALHYAWNETEQTYDPQGVEE